MHDGAPTPEKLITFFGLHLSLRGAGPLGLWASGSMEETAARMDLVLNFKTPTKIRTDRFLVVAHFCLFQALTPKEVSVL